jgi:dTMP kinase
VTGRGRLIAFEGGEGSGKSTQAAHLARDLGAVLTGEPGGTPLGRRIRPLLLGRGEPPPHPRAEALLLAADRAQHATEVVTPALERGDDVVTDRFTPSSLAYQGYGRGLDVDALRGISAWATGGLEPDVVVLLDVPRDAARSRLGDPSDRFESEGEDFHRRVAEGFAALARLEPERWVVVDGLGPVEEVAARVRAAVADRLAGRPA